MCVALPGRIVSIGEPNGVSLPALVRLGEVDRSVDLCFVPEANVGDYVVVHSGYALRVVAGLGPEPPRAAAERRSSGGAVAPPAKRVGIVSADFHTANSPLLLGELEAESSPLPPRHLDFG